MSDYTETLKLIKKAAIDAVAASKPVTLCFGKIVTSLPIRIDVEQKIILGENQIVLTQSMERMLPGDEVVLLRIQGGQKYIVLDKVAT